MVGRHAPRLGDLGRTYHKYTQIEKSPSFAVRHCVDLSFTVEYHIDLIPGSLLIPARFPVRIGDFTPENFPA